MGIIDRLVNVNEVMYRSDLGKILRRFHSRYIPEPMSGCWIWLGAADRKGYGKMNLGNEVYVKAHRLSYVVHKGPIYKLALHHCDNPYCVNPDHIYDGDHRDNTKESWDKGRRDHIIPSLPRGSNSPRSKLTEAQVIDIRGRLDAGETRAKVSRAFGVTYQTVTDVRDRKTWRHV